MLPALLVWLSLLVLTPDQTPDSARYLLAAESLRANGTYGEGYLHWPPLYPSLLALHALVGVEATTFAAMLGNLGALLSIIGVWVLGRRLLTSPHTLTVVVLAWVCVTRFGTVFAHVWSEAVFLPLMVWLTYYWARHLDEKQGWVGACVLLALALLTRHVGVVLAVAMGLTALRWRKWPALGGIILACVPYALWLWRTYEISGTLTGPRSLLPNPDLFQKAELFGQVWGHWIFPHAYFLSGGVIVATACLAAFASALPFVRRSGLLCFAVLVVLGHSVLTIYSASRTTLDVDSRTLFPTFWLALLVLGWAVERCLARLSPRSAKFAKISLAAYIFVWFSAPNAIINAVV